MGTKGSEERAMWPHRTNAACLPGTERERRRGESRGDGEAARAERFPGAERSPRTRRSLDLEDPVVDLAARRDDRHLVADAAAHQRGPDGRDARDPALAAVRLGRADDLDTTVSSPSSSSLTRDPISTRAPRSVGATTCATLSFASSALIRPSRKPCSSRAAWYSAFSLRSPCSRAVAIRLMTPGRSASSPSSSACEPFEALGRDEHRAPAAACAASPGRRRRPQTRRGRLPDRGPAAGHAWPRPVRRRRPPGGT